MKREAKKDTSNAHKLTPDKLAAFKRAVSDWKAEGRPGRFVVVKKPTPKGKGEK